MCLLDVQAYVLDFGSEMYVWTGKHVPLDARRHILKLASEHWQTGYNYTEFTVNPLCPLMCKRFFVARLYNTVYLYSENCLIL